jgi:hypothetical protein
MASRAPMWMTESSWPKSTTQTRDDEHVMEEGEGGAGGEGELEAQGEVNEDGDEGEADGEGGLGGEFFADEGADALDVGAGEDVLAEFFFEGFLDDRAGLELTADGDDRASGGVFLLDVVGADGHFLRVPSAF